MVEKAGVCLFQPPFLTEAEAAAKLSLQIPGYPVEEFKYIYFEDIIQLKYFITSYGRIFTSYGRELFPEEYIPPKQNKTYLRIELSCSSYIKRRKFFIHRLVANAFIPKTVDDIAMNRNLVNHKFNTDGRCNYAWNLEWVNDSENALHGMYFNEEYDESLFDQQLILSRRDLINYNQNGELNPKSRISEFQVHLICQAYTELGYSIEECAIYAWMEANPKDLLIIRSIIGGYSWTHISSQYGIKPGNKRSNIKRAIPIRPEKKDEYDTMRNKKRR